MPVSYEKFPVTNFAACLLLLLFVCFSPFPAHSGQEIPEVSEIEPAYCKTECISPLFAVSLTCSRQADKFHFKIPSVLFASFQLSLTYLFHFKS